MNPLQIIWNVDPEIFKIGGFSIRYYSVLFGVAFYLGYWLMRNVYRQEGKDEQQLTPLLFYIIVGTVIGARLGQTLFYEFGYFKNHPLEIILPFRFGNNGFEWTGYRGLASHGGAIGILIALGLFCKKYQQSFLWVLDRLVMVVALGGFFIRLGNLFNSEIIGKPTTVSWAFVFQQIDMLPRHPSQLYEAVAYLLVFFVLWTIYQRKATVLPKGFLFGLFLVLVFSVRFFIEFSKEVQEAWEKALPINMGQILSIPFIAVGLYFLFKKKVTPKVVSTSPKNYKNGA